MVYVSDGLEPLLGRPFAVVDADMDRGELSVCYIMQGHGTELLSGLKLGSFVKVRGLLGVPLPVSGKKNIPNRRRSWYSNLYALQ